MSASTASGGAASAAGPELARAFEVESTDPTRTTLDKSNDDPLTY